METPGQRFQYWVTKVVGVSIVKMAEIIGVEHRTLYNVIHDQNVTIIGKKTLTLLKQKFPKFPWQWIKEGTGDAPDASTAEVREIVLVDGADLKIRDMEILSLRKENEGLRSLVEAAENNNKRLESLIVHYERLYKDCSDQLEIYKGKKS